MAWPCLLCCVKFASWKVAKCGTVVPQSDFQQSAANSLRIRKKQSWPHIFASCPFFIHPSKPPPTPLPPLSQGESPRPFSGGHRGQLAATLVGTRRQTPSGMPPQPLQLPPCLRCPPVAWESGCGRSRLWAPVGAVAPHQGAEPPAATIICARYARLAPVSGMAW